MGKKGSWLSALKRIFAPSSKDKPPPYPQATDRKHTKDQKKKWGLGKLRHAESNSFIPLHREPSSVEKILGDADREYKRLGDHLQLSDGHQKSTPSFSSRELPKSLAAEKPNSSLSTKNIDNSQRHKKPIYSPKLVIPNYHKNAAIRIQAAYRGYAARRSYRALKGLVRLQGVMRGQSVKRQTMNAMKCMQMLVRVQTQIHSRRVQMMESQSVQRPHRGHQREQENSLSGWTLTPPSEKEQQQGEWDDSMLTKEEIDARLQRKMEAVSKRERALAYAYSHQLWKATPKSAYDALSEIRTGGFPWWGNWVDRHMVATLPKDDQQLPLPRPSPEPHNPVRFNQATTQPKLEPSSFDTGTLQSPKFSPALTKTKTAKQAKPKSGAPEFSPRTPVRDDESLTSCPPFSVPNYMTPTVSAKAKVRAYGGSPKERMVAAGATPRAQPRKRMSLSQSIGSFGWSKGGGLFSGKDSASQRMTGTPKPMHAIGNISVDSTLSLPAGLGRKPFKFK